MLDRIDIEARDHGRLGRIGRGKDEALLPVLARGERDGQRALDRAHFACWELATEPFDIRDQQSHCISGS